MVTPSIESLTWLREQVEQADGDLLREMVRTVAEALMSAEATALCNAGYGERTPERTNARNGYRGRRWDTRVGTMEVAIPKLRKGSYFPDWLVEPRRRAERGLVARGLSGVALVVSDAHQGLTQAIAAVLPGAGWQRCRTHFSWNLKTRVPKAAQDLVGSLVRSIFAQPEATAVWAQHDRVVRELTDRFPAAADLLAEAAPDRLAFTAFPVEHWRQIWSNNPQERLNREIRRRTDVVGIFPNRAAIVRLVGAA